MNRTLYITMGLPGSGKTTWSNEKLNQLKGLNTGVYSQIIDIDAIMKRGGNLSERLLSKLNNLYHTYNNTILDGLFLNNDDLLKILDVLKLCRYKFDVIEINYWNENKELCLWNDKYRRSLNSKSNH